MTRDEIRRGVLLDLNEIAPEADLSRLDPAVPLRDQLDLDSVDMLHFVAAMDARFGVAVPEVDYPRMATLDGCVEYLAGRIPVSPI